MARQAVEMACRQVNAYPLTLTTGNPTQLNAESVLFLIKSAPRDPVVVMVDDGGRVGEGPGEAVLSELLAAKDEIEVLGVVAVASDTHVDRGAKVEKSWDNQGLEWIGPVDKRGLREKPEHVYVEGDTAELLFLKEGIMVVGCGDLGKMNDGDSLAAGAKITTKCLKSIIDEANRKGGKP